jgi:hypothetical protein
MIHSILDSTGVKCLEITAISPCLPTFSFSFHINIRNCRAASSSTLSATS